MRDAADEAAECQRVLGKGGLNIVGELLRGHGTFFELEHYPPQDVFDPESASQYYYHAHRGASGEHGHFHTFLRAAGMPRGTRPMPYAGPEPWPEGDDALSHLIAISMDPWGRLCGLFAVNRWVTGDTWYPAQDVVRMLEHFRIGHAHPSWPVNRWLGALFVLLRPHMRALLLSRDAVVEEWARDHPGEDVFEDRRLEVTGFMRLDLDVEISRVRKAAAGRGD